MPANFEWQTEEEQEDIWELPTPARPKRRRRWAVPLALASLLAIVLYTGISKANQRISDAEAQAADEVRASQSLARQAAFSADRELFVTVLSGSNPAWTEMQNYLLRENLQFEQAGRALGLEPRPEQTEVEAISFTPEMTEAEVVSLHSYATNGGQELQLAQSRIYRRGGDRWLLSPPKREYWGAWERWQGRHLVLHYPARDVEPAQELAERLDAVLIRLCAATFGLNCPDGFAVRVRLEKEPDALLIVDEPLGAPLVAGEIDLPTFSLVGVPVDDGAQDALFRAYAQQVIPTVISELVRYNCCDHIVYFRAALDWQLQELGVARWPLQYSQYERLLDGSGDEWRMLERTWTAGTLPAGTLPGPERPEQWYAYSLVESLVADAGLRAPWEAANLQRNLSKAPDLFTWVQMSRDYETVDALLRRWRAHLFERLNRQELRASLPGQDLLLSRCAADGSSQHVRYDAQSGRWFPAASQTGQWAEPQHTLPAPAAIVAPSGNSALYQDGGRILRAVAGTDPVEVGIGIRPFWLTAEWYGYISDKQLFLAHISDDQPQHILSLQEVYEKISGDLLRRLLVIRILAVPDASGNLALLVDSPYEDTNYVVLLRAQGSAALPDSLRNAEVSVLFQTRGKVQETDSMRFSNDGRWLAVTTVGRAAGGFYLYDMASQRLAVNAASYSVTGSPSAVSTQSWSEDGRWLAWLTGEHVELVSLNTEQAYRHFLPLPEELVVEAAQCPALAWVGRSDGS